MQSGDLEDRAGAGSNPDRVIDIRADFAAHRMSKKRSPSAAILPRRPVHMGELAGKGKRRGRMGALP